MLKAYRIQGYLSFLPKDLEPSLRSGSRSLSVWAYPTVLETRTEQASASSFPPPLERLWALPMVVVEGLCLRAESEVACSKHWQILTLEGLVPMH